MRITVGLLALLVLVLVGGYYWDQSASPSFSVPVEHAQEGPYTRSSIATHNTAQDCWASIEGGVYDLSGWIAQHPGGEAAILTLCGKDATEAFKEEHARNTKANEVLASFKIGELAN